MQGAGKANDLQSLRKGDPRAFSNLYDQYWEKLYTVAFRHVQDEDLSKDIVQEVFINLWERRHLIQTAYDTVEPYLMKAVKNKVLNYYNREKVKKHVLDQVLLRMQYTIGEDWDLAREYRKIESHLEIALNALPEKMRQVYLLRNEHHSIHEIAERLEMAEQTVKNYLSEANSRLRKDMTKYLADYDSKLMMMISLLFTIS